jgi:hypothetical protein
MNNWNLSEDRLRSWNLRAPSAELGRRLFGPPAPARRPFLRKPRWGWLVPAAGALWLAAMTLAPNGFDLNTHASSRTRSLASVAGGPLAWRANEPLERERNVVTAVLEWTNADSPRASLRSFVRYATNGLSN